MWKGLSVIQIWYTLFDFYGVCCIILQMNNSVQLVFVLFFFKYIRGGGGGGSALSYRHHVGVGVVL